jgi:hypothetical protein
MSSNRIPAKVGLIFSSRSFFEEQRHRIGRPIHRPIRALGDVGDDHEATRNDPADLIDHAAFDVRISFLALTATRGAIPVKPTGAVGLFVGGRVKNKGGAAGKPALSPGATSSR